MQTLSSGAFMSSLIHHSVTAIVSAFTLAVGLAASTAHAQKPFKVEQRWTIPGDGGWDYLTVDPGTHRLFIAHLSKIDVVDTNNGKVVGSIPGIAHAHGIVLLPDGKTGFISDGGANNIVVFNQTTLAVTTKINAGTNPDGMVYEKSTKTLWAFNGASKNATIIDVTKLAAMGTIALPGKPEFPTTDDAGTIFVNIEDKNAIVKLDAKSQKVTATWPLAGCESPSGMAMDKTGGRLFSVCDGKKMTVTDMHTGKSLATPTIGEGPDAACYDPGTKLAFASNGDGTLSVVDAGKPGYSVVQTVRTMSGARTMALDPTTGKIYTVSAKIGTTPAATAVAPHPRPSHMPGTFTVLVIGRD
jgi:YVTN family beta-propeller protein